MSGERLRICWRVGLALTLIPHARTTGRGETTSAAVSRPPVRRHLRRVRSQRVARRGDVRAVRARSEQRGSGVGDATSSRTGTPTVRRAPTRPSRHPSRRRPSRRSRQARSKPEQAETSRGEAGEKSAEQKPRSRTTKPESKGGPAPVAKPRKTGVGRRAGPGHQRPGRQGRQARRAHGGQGRADLLRAARRPGADRAEHGRVPDACPPPPRCARSRSSCCGTTAPSSTTTSPAPAAARCPSPTSSASRWSRRCARCRR